MDVPGAIDPEASNRPIVARVENVDVATDDADGRREVAPTVDDLESMQVCTFDVEDGECVAAGIDGEEQVIVGVVGQRTLRREGVDDSAGLRAAQAAGRVLTDPMQATVARATVREHRVACGIVGLHEDSVVDALRTLVIRLTCIGARGQGECSERHTECPCRCHHCQAPDHGAVRRY